MTIFLNYTKFIFQKKWNDYKNKDYINKKEVKINTKYKINDILVHKTNGNIIIIDEQFNSDCIAKSKQSNNALQIIAEKIAFNLFNAKNIII